LEKNKGQKKRGFFTFDSGNMSAIKDTKVFAKKETRAPEINPAQIIVPVSASPGLT
jgi:hypothetical protein